MMSSKQDSSCMNMEHVLEYRNIDFQPHSATAPPGSPQPQETQLPAPPVSPYPQLQPAPPAPLSQEARLYGRTMQEDSKLVAMFRAVKEAHMYIEKAMELKS